MFCCTKKQTHFGEIVTSICKQSQCETQSNQLCCSLCIQQEHKNHETVSLKQYIPTLLKIEHQKKQTLKSIDSIIKELLPQQYAYSQLGVEHTLRDTLKKVQEQLQKNLENNNKIKQAMMMMSVQQIQHGSNINSNLFATNKSNVSVNGEYGFSHKNKHPHISISSNSRTVTKSTNTPHKVGVLSNNQISPQESRVSIKIDSSGGNVMIGLCHQNIVKQKDYINCYGMGNGAYLLGQNGNNPHSAICFHHKNSNFNRKQIVGWNFAKGDTIIIQCNFQQEYILFRNKAQDREFVMPVQGLKQFETSLKVFVMLQTEGDQISLIQSNYQF